MGDIVVWYMNQNSKSETRNPNQNRKYDLEDRTLQFAKDIRGFAGTLPKTILNIDDIKQLLRSSGSVGANFREANDSLSRKDFLMRAKISRKEAKETIYWLELLVIPDEYDTKRENLKTEATELMNILGAIIRNTK